MSYTYQAAYQLAEYGKAVFYFIYRSRKLIKNHLLFHILGKMAGTVPST
jgi:hypothetical protein